MKHIVALSAILIHFSFETYWLLSFLMPDISYKIPQPILAHAGASFIAALFALPFLKERFHLPWYSLSFAFTFLSLTLLPFFGSLLILTTLTYLVFVKKDKKMAFSVEDMEADMYQFFEFEKPERSEEELGETLARALEIEPYVDILKGHDTELKKGALNKLSEIVDPNSVKIMRIALHDDNAEVRLMASKSLSKIEETINNELVSAIERVNKEPRNIDARNSLGTVYYRYASLNLHDESSQHFHLQNALNEFLTSLQINPKQEKILLFLGKIFLLIHNFEKAKEIFRKIIQINPKKLTPHLLLCDAYLGTKEFLPLQGECEYIKNNFKKTTNIQELIEYWLQHERNHTKSTT